MKIKLAVAILVLASASTATAQSSPIKILVGAEANPESQHVADRLSGQIGSASRYALVTESGSENILLSVDCLSNVVGERRIGLTCDTVITYWPVPGVFLYWDLTGSLAEAENESDVSQSLFDAFVKETSDERLSQATATFKERLNSAISAYPKGVASLHPSIQLRNTRATLAVTTKNPRQYNSPGEIPKGRLTPAQMRRESKRGQAEITPGT
jgi:hypothetical protein